MRNLLDFLAKHHHWFVFLLLETVSLVLLFRYNSYQSSVWFSSANVVAGKVYEVDAALNSFLSMRQLNTQLTERNLVLEREVDRLSRLLVDKTQDSALVSGMRLAALQGMKLIPAKVVSNELNSINNFMTIDKGLADGVRKDMGVACGNGVVGIVYLVSDHYSVVIPLLSAQSHVSCAIKDRGYFGYLRWDGKATDIAYVDDIPRHAKFKLGTDVVTSGFSSMFPPGILVGKILHVFNSPDGLSYRLQIRLSTDFGNLRDVCVIDDSVMKERLELLRVAEDSMAIGKE